MWMWLGPKLGCAPSSQEMDEHLKDSRPRQRISKDGHLTAYSDTPNPSRARFQFRRAAVLKSDASLL